MVCHLCLWTLLLQVGLEFCLQNSHSTELTLGAGVRTLSEVAGFVRVRSLPVTARVRTLDLQIVDLQSHGVIRERVAECDLCSIVGADIVTRVDDWSYTLQAEPMSTWRLYTCIHDCFISPTQHGRQYTIYNITWKGFFRTHRQIAHLRYSWTSSKNMSSGSSSVGSAVTDVRVVSCCP